MTDPNKEPEEMVPTHGGEPIVDDPPEKSDVDSEFVEKHRNRASRNDLDALKE